MTMIPLEDLVDKYTDKDTDVIDLEELNVEMTEILAVAKSTINPLEMLLVGERYSDTMFDYLGNLFLTFADEMGALPEGQEVEIANFQLYKAHSKIVAVYQLAVSKERIEKARSGLVVPGQTEMTVEEAYEEASAADDKPEPDVLGMW